MFTGLVAETGEARSIERADGGVRVEVRAALAADVAPGDSISLSGVCLTAVSADGETFAVEAVPETLERSSLGELTEGDRVNLELAVRAADRLGGHIVQGHVDAIGRVESIAPEGRSRRVAINAGDDVGRYVVDKGSIALDGVSLTAVDAGADGFSVVLIPETMERTTLGALAAGDAVNIEVDVVAKYVEKLMPRPSASELAAAGGRP
jgi:riboflavin synthase